MTDTGGQSGFLPRSAGWTALDLYFAGKLLAIILELDARDPPRPPLAYQWHWRQLGIGNGERCSSGFVRPGNPGLVRNRPTIAWPPS